MFNAAKITILYHRDTNYFRNPLNFHPFFSAIAMHLHALFVNYI